ncbi:MAG: MOSC domain-containing protein [Pseudomonadota bacterium]
MTQAVFRVLVRSVDWEAVIEKLSDLISRTAQPGRVTWIGLRPDRREDLVSVPEVEIDDRGLVGDHGTSVKRAVTLVQAEHLAAIGSFLGRGPVDPAALRRNIVVEGVNLLTLRKRQVKIGQVHLQITGLCAPCSRMEEAFGEGGYGAVRGHGGVTAEVIHPGSIQIGDVVTPLD